MEQFGQPDQPVVRVAMQLSQELRVAEPIHHHILHQEQQQIGRQVRLQQAEVTLIPDLVQLVLQDQVAVPTADQAQVVVLLLIAGRAQVVAPTAGQVVVPTADLVAAQAAVHGAAVHTVAQAEAALEVQEHPEVVPAAALHVAALHAVALHVGS